jgi:hypothetical protein
MKLMERLFDNAWYVASTEPTVRADIAAELLRAEQAHDVAVAEVQRAREISYAAVALALSGVNSTRAALGRAETKAAAAARCTHVVDGHALSVTRSVGVTGIEEVLVASCTLERTATLSPPDTLPVWTARLTDPSDPGAQPRLVRLAADHHESFEQACHWVATGALPSGRPHDLHRVHP